jgi:predicted O-methyltransferase YrrM
VENQLWSAVDEYTEGLLMPPDPVLEAALAASKKAGLPSISVSPSQGKLLMLLAKLAGAARILEIGTLGGYSSIWMARALPANGRLITLEGDARAGIQQLVAEGQAPFDLFFIDADKRSIPHYLEWSLKLAHPGSLIIVDNVVRDGKLIDAQSDDPNVQGARQLHQMLTAEPRLTATTIQTVGSKGYDGFTLALVTE